MNSAGSPKLWPLPSLLHFLLATKCLQLLEGAGIFFRGSKRLSSHRRRDTRCSGSCRQGGPSLNSLAQRSFLAGTLPKTPTDLEHWLMHPQSIHPGTAMPDMGVTPADAQTIAAFLQTDR
jgi:hypothetical protein